MSEETVTISKEHYDKLYADHVEISQLRAEVRAEIREEEEGQRGEKKGV